ncbi:MAG: ThiF family adenylyltransferase [Burkholderiaceae bacterium]
MTSAISPATDTRYLRHTQIDGFSQPSIAALNVIVVGAGAIGNEVIKNLALLGVATAGGSLTVFDLDRVERHNLTRSVLLRETDIGRDKAHAVVAHAQVLEPACHLIAVNGDIAETLSLQQVADADIVIGCIDNFEARIRINQLCLIAGTPWINTAIDSRYASVDIFPFAQTQPLPCYECTLPASVYDRIAERRSCGGLLKVAQSQQVMPTTTITTSVAGALAANQALVLTGCDTRLPGGRSGSSFRLFADLLTGITTRSDLARADLCAGCDAFEWHAGVAHQAVSATELRAFIQDDQPHTHDVMLSDALIAAAACTNCGPRQHTDSLIGRRAASVPDSVIVCAECGEASVAIDIQDQFELPTLVDLMGTKPLPGAWARLDHQFVSLGIQQQVPARTSTPSENS